MFCTKCGSQLADGQTVCGACGFDPAAVSSVRPAPNLPMKWYKFLIYFMLFLSALTYGLQTVRHFFLSEHAAYYKSIPMFLVFDIVLGIWALATAVLSLTSRFSLAGFKKNGPAMFLTYYAIAAGYEIADQIISWFANAEPLNGLSLCIGIGLNILIFVLHRTYFKKREHLFVN